MNGVHAVVVVVLAYDVDLVFRNHAMVMQLRFAIPTFVQVRNWKKLKYVFCHPVHPHINSLWFFTHVLSEQW